MGVVTDVMLRLAPKPQNSIYLTFLFDSFKDVINAYALLHREDLRPSRSAVIYNETTQDTKGTLLLSFQGNGVWVRKVARVAKRLVSRFRGKEATTNQAEQLLQNGKNQPLRLLENHFPKKPPCQGVFSMGTLLKEARKKSSFFMKPPIVLYSGSIRFTHFACAQLPHHLTSVSPDSTRDPFTIVVPNNSVPQSDCLPRLLKKHLDL